VFPRPEASLARVLPDVLFHLHRVERCRCAPHQRENHLLSLPTSEFKRKRPRQSANGLRNRPGRRCPSTLKRQPGPFPDFAQQPIAPGVNGPCFSHPFRPASRVVVLEHGVAMGGRATRPGPLIVQLRACCGSKIARCKVMGTNSCIRLWRRARAPAPERVPAPVNLLVPVRMGGSAGRVYTTHGAGVMIAPVERRLCPVENVWSPVCVGSLPCVARPIK